MLKRYQILLNDWLADFAKDRADKFDMSFSENIRLGLCIYYGSMIAEIYPEYKFDFTTKKVMGLIRKYIETSKGEEEMHKTLSNIYFETRKAMEYYNKQEEKKNQKQ